MGSRRRHQVARLDLRGASPQRLTAGGANGLPDLMWRELQSGAERLNRRGGEAQARGCGCALPFAAAGGAGKRMERRREPASEGTRSGDDRQARALLHEGIEQPVGKSFAAFNE